MLEQLEQNKSKKRRTNAFKTVRPSFLPLFYFCGQSLHFQLFFPIRKFPLPLFTFIES